MSRTIERTEDSLAVLKSLRDSGHFTLKEIGEYAGDISRQRVHQLLNKVGNTAGQLASSVDPVRMFRVLRTDPSVSSLNKLRKAIEGVSYLTLRECFEQLGLWEAVQRLFRLRKWRKRQETKNEMLQHLRELSTELGRTAGALDVDRAGKFSHVYYHKCFGGMMNAQRLAGLIPNETGRHQVHSDSDLLAHLQELSESLGRPPRHQDVRDAGKFSSHPYTNRFGGLKKALRLAGVKTTKRRRSRPITK